jgi:hypothetical protein
MRDVVLFTALVLVSLVEAFTGCAAEVVACTLSILRTDVCPTRTAQYCRLFQIGYVAAAMGVNQLATYLGYGAVGGQSIVNTCRSLTLAKPCVAQPHHKASQWRR